MDSESLPNNQSNNSWSNFSMRELPKTSPDRLCNLYIKEIERSEQIEKLAHFIDEKLSNEPKSYGSIEEFYTENPKYRQEIHNNLTESQKFALKRYSGREFPWINTVARGHWDYEKLGPETPEEKSRISRLIQEMKGAIRCAPAVNNDFVTYRGTNLDGFREYGVFSIEELTALKDQFYLEKGFTSTALVQDKSFAQVKPSGLWIGDSNIEIKYHLPAGSHDYVGLFSEEFSYSPEQSEVLLDSWSLSYISDVKIDGDCAYLDMILIPKELYDSLPQ